MRAFRDMMPLRILVSISAMGSVMLIVNAPRRTLRHQLDLITPGISPWSARFLKQIRHMSNLRMYPRGLPQMGQRLRYRTLKRSFRGTK
jgi:hypothetical protein